jgi:hypothetical protein
MLCDFHRLQNIHHKGFIGKYFFLNGLGDLWTKKPRQMTGAFFMFYIQYRCWRETSTPRDCAGLARGFAVLGIDRLSAGKPLVYLMYPQAETSEGRIDPFDADNFQYEISVKEISYWKD